MKLVCLTCLLVLCALPAQAHGSLPGLGGFYAGALHPFLALDHLLTLLAGGLCLGRDDKRAPLLGLGAGVLIGLWWGVPVDGLTGVLLVIMLGFGVVLAMPVRLPAGFDIALFLMVGLVIGFQTDLPSLNIQIAAVGTGVAVFLIAMNAFALASVLARSWAAIALRVAGAWVFAASLMVLAFEVAGRA